MQESDARDYCVSKAAETLRKGKAGYWGLGKIWSTIIAEVCFRDCIMGVNMCRSEEDLYVGRPEPETKK